MAPSSPWPPRLSNSLPSQQQQQQQQQQSQQRQLLQQQLREKPLPPPPPPSPPPPSPPPRSHLQWQQPIPAPNAHLEPEQQARNQQPPTSLPTRPRQRPVGPGASRSGDRPRNQSQMTDFEFVDGSLIQVESSSSDSDFRPTTSRPPQHGRSMSHPFPSLFSSKKKRPPRPQGGTRYLGPGSSDDEADATMSSLKAPAHQPYQRHGQSAGSKDLTTGNCITCGSLVRWPKDLSVFKCTICMTINDLKPSDLDSKPGRPREDDAGTSYVTPVQPISLEHTKLLVGQCLRSVISLTLSQHANNNDQLLRQGLQTSSGAPVTVTPAGPGRGEPASSSRLRESEGNGSTLLPQIDTSHLVESPLEESSLLEVVNYNRLPPRSFSTSHADQRPVVQGLPRQHNGQLSFPTPSPPEADPKKVFKPLEDYMAVCCTSWQSLNCSFGGRRPSPNTDPAEGPRKRHPTHDVRAKGDVSNHVEGSIAELDAKLLLLGDFAENGMWWTGGQEGIASRAKTTVPGRAEETPAAPTTRSPGIDWAEMEEWYSTIVNAGQPWKAVYDGMVDSGVVDPATDADLRRLEAQVLAGQDHVQRVLLKATETLLKRPGRPLLEATDLRFLLIILSNPLLSAKCRMYTGHYTRSGGREKSDGRSGLGGTRGTGPASGQHSGIIKRILGLISHSPNECHNQLIAWLARYPEHRFLEAKDLVGGFLAYRLIRQKEKKQEVRIEVTDGLIPNMSADRSVATLHAALGQPSGHAKNPKERSRIIVFQDDWQIKAASRVMALIFAANNLRSSRRSPQEFPTAPHGADSDRLRGRVHARGQLLPTSDFYISLLDDSDLLADFEAWETKRAKFSFCQYPFLLSIWAKIQILEHDAKRQMEKKARDAFFNSIMSRRNFDQYLHLTVRRDCLVEDSLKAVSEVIGSGGEDIKKGIRIAFRGEEGVDAGGLRKEWFLLLVREVFNPDHGLFVYDEDSQYCYFNPYSFETSDQYFLVGVVLGLAIYNSTILDIALPPFAFRKLLAAAPQPVGISPAHSRPAMSYTLDDLAEYRPRLARGLRQLLEYEGDVETTFCLDFVVDLDKYGSVERVPLVPGGENRAVTNSNRREYVDLHVRYMLDTSVSRQFDPFKRGFFTVCGGNALSLFGPEEIELLVRGSEESLDISSLRAVAEYDGWRSRNAEETEPTVRWFWDSFAQASPSEQRKLLTFITGSDRIPAMGATSLVIKLVCLGDDCGRYPTARTCFNTLALWRYGSKEKLGRMLWDAVHESEGFGLK